MTDELTHAMEAYRAHCQAIDDADNRLRAARSEVKRLEEERVEVQQQGPLIWKRLHQAILGDPNSTPEWMRP